jgi:hypothetical protein
MNRGSMNAIEGIGRIKTFANRLLVASISMAIAVLFASSTLRVTGLRDFFLLLNCAGLAGGVLRVSAWILEGFLQPPSAQGLPSDHII